MSCLISFVTSTVSFSSSRKICTNLRPVGCVNSCSCLLLNSLTSKIYSSMSRFTVRFKASRLWASPVYIVGVTDRLFGAV
ncbi:hypothetical protein BDU57DRAFT_513176 [Ampelomyces quisqualis]|uniref:Uncharacterized protein n=1 Tax=Ampelomyces quisqualis TaxID=50730 RepID=A0A6A5QYG2_AMPQU|nr:hypothetical protein BDU57DRAFT_513176 [Ampelomyces quisqualis]